MKLSIPKAMSVTILLFFTFMALYSLSIMGIYFHTDIARDFLLFDDIVNNNHITLIGPRSGGISGVFHGPAWLYLHIPIFLLTKGNPYFIGVFWIFLALLGVVVTALCIYYITKKKEYAWWGLAFATPIYLYSSLQLFNPFGAVILAPLFFISFLTYLYKPSFIKIALTLLLIGFSIQFQMAFAAPILVLSSFVLVFQIIKTRRWIDFLSYGLLLIPLFTFIVFDLRHDFLQLRAVTTYLITAKTKYDGFFWQGYAQNRFESFVSGFGLLPYTWLNGIYLCLFFWAWFKRKQLSQYNRLALSLGLFLYMGYFILTLAYRDTLWGYYTWPFVPIGILVLFSILPLLPRWVRYCVIGLPIVLWGFSNMQSVLHIKEKAASPGFWPFYQSTAKLILKDAPQEFSYYIYTPDQYGYSERYAMKYESKIWNKTATENQKKTVTYLLIAPPPSDKKYLNGDWWKKERVRITKQPTKTWKLKNGYIIEKYILTEIEQKIESDPLLLNTLIFR